jgi:hypothetical protein
MIRLSAGFEQFSVLKNTVENALKLIDR